MNSHSQVVFVYIVTYELRLLLVICLMHTDPIEVLNYEYAYHVYMPSITKETLTYYIENILVVNQAFSYHSGYFGTKVPISTDITISLQIRNEYCSVTYHRLI